MINISPTAIKEIKRIQSNKQTLANSSLRLAVKSGGCSGLFYDLKLESEALAISPENHLLEIDGVTIVIDANSWQYVENLKLDYSEDLMGGGFRFHNPQVRDICGCGISFALKK